MEGNFRLATSFHGIPTTRRSIAIPKPSSYTSSFLPSVFRQSSEGNPNASQTTSISSGTYDDSKMPIWTEPEPFTVSKVPELGELVRHEPLKLGDMRQASQRPDGSRLRLIRAAEIVKRAKYLTWSDSLMRSVHYGKGTTAEEVEGLVDEVMQKENQYNFKREYFEPNPSLKTLPERWLAETLQLGSKPTVDTDLQVTMETQWDMAHVQEHFGPFLAEFTENTWASHPRAAMIARCISNIKNPQQVKKIMCIGLGRIASHATYVDRANNKRRFVQGDEVTRNSGAALHGVAIKIAEQLQQMTGNKIDLYAADPSYDRYHKDFLESLRPTPFTVLDASYESQEHWPVIDDSTFVLSDLPSDERVKPLVFEYARPAVMITGKPRYEDRVAQYDEPCAQDEEGFPLYPFDATWVEVQAALNTWDHIAIPVCREGREVARVLEADYVEEREFRAGPSNSWWNSSPGTMRMYVRKDLTEG